MKAKTELELTIYVCVAYQAVILTMELYSDGIYGLISFFTSTVTCSQ